jgi:hypothetical protein
MQVMCEENSAVGQHAVAELQELRKKIFEDPSLELDQQTKRLRQANFKQQYKLRQERSCTELTDVEQEALRACGVVEVLDDVEAEHTADGENCAVMRMATKLPTPAWNQAIVAGMRALPSGDLGDTVDGLFVAEKHAQSAQHNKRKPPGRAKVRSSCARASCSYN